MTRAELIRYLNSKPREELLRLLYLIENATADMYPVSNRYAKLYVEIERLEGKWNREEMGRSRSNTAWLISLLLCVIVGILTFLILPAGMMRLVGIILFIIALLFVVIMPFVAKAHEKKQNELELQIQSMEEEMDNIMEQMVVVTEQYPEAFELRRIICPVECSDPELMRVYVDLFEEEQVRSLRDAKELFDAYLCKVNMGKYMDQQESTARAARQAAENEAFSIVMAQQQVHRVPREEPQVQQEPPVPEEAPKSKKQLRKEAKEKKKQAALEKKQARQEEKARRQVQEEEPEPQKEPKKTVPQRNPIPTEDDDFFFGDDDDDDD